MEKRKKLIMQNNKHSGSLKDTFQDFGAAPSEPIWDNIADALGEKKKRRFIIWWWFGGLAAVLAISYSTYQIGFQKGEDSVLTNVEAQNVENDPVKLISTEQVVAFENDDIDIEENSNDANNDFNSIETLEYGVNLSQRYPKQDPIPEIFGLSELLALSNKNNIKLNF